MPRAIQARRSLPHLPEVLVDAPALLRVGESARRLRVHDRTVRRWIEDGRLPVIRLGRSIRIERDALARFLHGEAV